MSFAPEPEADGLRRYGRWGGNPNGTKEDVTRCIESVASESRSPISHQCSKKRGHGPDGLYCVQHNPERVAARQQAAMDKYNKKFDDTRVARRASRLALAERVREACAQACEAVSDRMSRSYLDDDADQCATAVREMDLSKIVEGE